jgi:predicted ester cyclase
MNATQCGVLLALEQAEASMLTDPTVELVRDWVEAIWNQGHLERVLEFHPSSFMNEGQLSSPEHARLWHERMRATYPDLAYTIKDIFACGDRVALRWMATGTQAGELWGLVPPTHKRVTWGGSHLLRVVDGQIVEVWAFTEFAALLEQLGVRMEPPPEAG